MFEFLIRNGKFFSLVVNTANKGSLRIWANPQCLRAKVDAGLDQKSLVHASSNMNSANFWVAKCDFGVHQESLFKYSSDATSVAKPLIYELFNAAAVYEKSWCHPAGSYL